MDAPKQAFQARYANVRLVTPTTIYNTVMTDGPTYLWFTKVLFIYNVVTALQSAQVPVGRHQRAYRNYSLMAIMMVVVSAAGGGIFCLGKDVEPFSMGAVGLLTGLGALLFLIKRREHIASLAAKLVEINRADDPLGMTLYQMGEIYARRYQIPSLVETVWSWDYVLKYAFMFTYYGAFGLYFLSFRDTVLWTVGGCVLAVCVFQLYFLLRQA